MKPEEKPRRGVDPERRSVGDCDRQRDVGRGEVGVRDLRRRAGGAHATHRGRVRARAQRDRRAAEETPAKGRSPAGTQAARRVDALLGGARTPGRRGVAAADERVRDSTSTRSATARPSSEIPCAYVRAAWWERSWTLVRRGADRAGWAEQAQDAGGGGGVCRQRRCESERLGSERGRAGERRRARKRRRRRRKRAAEVDEAGESAAGFERRGGHQRPHGQV